MRGYFVPVTTACNAACWFCSTKQIKDKAGFNLVPSFIPVDYQRLLSVFAHLKRNGVDELEFTGGGEPTLHEHLGVFSMLAKSVGMRTRLYTNGFCLLQKECFFDTVIISRTIDVSEMGEHTQNILEAVSFWRNHSDKVRVVTCVGRDAKLEDVKSWVSSLPCEVRLRPFFEELGFDKNPLTDIEIEGASWETTGMNCGERPVIAADFRVYKGFDFHESHLYFKEGYHKDFIPRGEFGELSKIMEEVNEAYDAQNQGVSLMVAIELSDVIGAIKGYLAKHLPGISFKDLEKMQEVTERAFLSGVRHD